MDDAGASPAIQSFSGINGRVNMLTFLNQTAWQHRGGILKRKARTDKLKLA